MSLQSPSACRGCSKIVVRYLSRHIPAAQYGPTKVFTRSATHAASGAANGAKDGPGKRLGAKKLGEEYVVPGNIIFRQRGTRWFPGENCDMGRDHTIFATQEGYVKYYRDPHRHPDRRYIGVVFERHWSLPSPLHAVRKRRLGMYAIRNTKRENDDATNLAEAATTSDGKAALHSPPVLGQPVKIRRRTLHMDKNYAYRETNWDIGRIQGPTPRPRRKPRVTPAVRAKAMRKIAAATNGPRGKVKAGKPARPKGRGR